MKLRLPPLSARQLGRRLLTGRRETAAAARSDELSPARRAVSRDRTDGVRRRGGHEGYPDVLSPRPLRRAPGAEGGFDPPSDRSHRFWHLRLGRLRLPSKTQRAWYHLRSTRGVASSRGPLDPFPSPTPSDPLIRARECSIRSCWCFLLEHAPTIQKEFFRVNPACRRTWVFANFVFSLPVSSVLRLSISAE